MNNTLSKMIQLYKDGKKDAMTEIWLKMLPLIKKQARKTCLMEYDDAFQEYSVSLIEAVEKINKYDTDIQCLSYISTSIKHRFCALYKMYCSKTSKEILCDFIPDKDESFSDYNDIVFLFDMENFMKQINSETKKNIINLSVFSNKSDTEIASLLGVSRQYVNRTRRELSDKIVSYLKEINSLDEV